MESKLPREAELLVKRRLNLKAILSEGVVLAEAKGESPYTIELDDIIKSKSFRKGRILEGDMISLGEVGQEQVYAYVDQIDGRTLHVTPFSEDIFLLLEDSNYNPTDFYTIVNNHIKC
jgi:hypothetical protein